MARERNDDLLGYAEIAELAGLTPATLRGLRWKGYLPEPDLMLADRPRWYRRTVKRWIAERPGPPRPERRVAS